MAPDQKVIISQIDTLIDRYENAKARAKYADLSDLPNEEAYEILTSMAAAVERLAPPKSEYAEKAKSSKGAELSIQHRVLAGILRALKTDYLSGNLQTISELIHAEGRVEEDKRNAKQKEEQTASRRNIMPLEKQEQRKGAYAFGVIFVIVILGIAIGIPNPTAFQYTVFRIVLALAAAGVAAMIPGFINVEVGTAVRAGGAIAVFVIVFFFSPAKLVVQPTQLSDALESEVTLDAGTYDVVQLVDKLAGLTGGVILDSDLTSKLKGRSVKIPSPLNSVSLKTVLDRIFKEIGISVDYANVSGTIVVREKGVS